MKTVVIFSILLVLAALAVGGLLYVAAVVAENWKT